MRLPSEAITLGDGYWVKREAERDGERQTSQIFIYKKRNDLRPRWIKRGRETKAIERKENSRVSGHGDHLGNSKLRATVSCPNPHIYNLVLSCSVLRSESHSVSPGHYHGPENRQPIVSRRVKRPWHWINNAGPLNSPSSAGSEPGFETSGDTPRVRALIWKWMQQELWAKHLARCTTSKWWHMWPRGS